MLKRKSAVWCFLGLWVSALTHAQGPAYTLGTGLLGIKDKMLPLSWQDTVPVYRDSALGILYTELSIEQTNCPVCMACAEPRTYYKGPFHPFSCGGGKGPYFICTRSTGRFHEIITDTLGTRAYLPAPYGSYRTWEQYILKEAEEGEYFRIIRQWDSTVLYNKPYPLQALPLPDAGLMVGLKFGDIDSYRFYPVAVQGYWLKLRAVWEGKTMGYCWIIWRSESRLNNWFAWRAD